MSENFSIANKTGARLPRLPFLEMKNDILKKNYCLSLAFVGKKDSAEINKQYKGRDKSANVLSFPLRRNEGEIVLCPAVVREEAKSFGKSFRHFLGFLVIHGMLHLKGMTHGSRMEATEKKYDQKYFCWNRRWIVHDASRGRRISKGRKKS
jgi:probable rRNA maturation factor